MPTPAADRHPPYPPPARRVRWGRWLQHDHCRRMARHRAATPAARAAVRPGKQLSLTPGEADHRLRRDGAG